MAKSNTTANLDPNPVPLPSPQPMFVAVGNNIVRVTDLRTVKSTPKGDRFIVTLTPEACGQPEPNSFCQIWLSLEEAEELMQALLRFQELPGIPVGKSRIDPAEDDGTPPWN